MSNTTDPPKSQPTPRKQGRPRTTFAQKRARSGLIVTHEKPEPAAPKPFRSPIQDAWPLTMCAELPLRADHWYEPVNP